ncbi:MAG: zinc ribbon domain-containing protein [Clostridia bacterium]|nr:zinc ribbon domain-containing protein [Clostridia bacterium]
MSFFDKLIKSFTNKVVDDATDKAAKAAAAEAEKKLKEEMAEAAKSAKEAEAAMDEAGKAASDIPEDDWKKAMDALKKLSELSNAGASTKKCPACGDTVKASCKFCPSCGAPMPAEPESKPERPVEKPAAAPVYDEDDSVDPMFREDGRDVSEKLREVLASEFPAYTFRENVSPAEIGGTGKFMNYSFAVYKDNAPKLFMMIIGKTTCTHREYRWSKEQAQKAGVTMINFIRHEPNSVIYIKDRLHKYL